MNYSLSDLLALPLFLGMGEREIEDILENIRLRCSHVRKGKVIVSAGCPCDSLIFVVKGNVVATRYSDDKSYYMDELLTSPLVVQPEHIFGMNQRYSMTFHAQSYCSVMVMEKAMVLKLMEKSMTFRLNMLNMVTTQTQKLQRHFWHPMPEEIDKRIIRFVKDHAYYPAGSKILHIKMNVMAKELGCSRLEISEALHSLQDRELLIIRRSFIEIPMLQLLLMQ